MTYRAGLPAPRYQSHPAKTPNHFPVSQPPGQVAASQMQSSKQAVQATAAAQQQQQRCNQAMQKAAAAPSPPGQELVVMHSLCTLEQLPVGTLAPSHCASPGQGRSLVALPDAHAEERPWQGTRQKPGQGTGQKQGQDKVQKPGQESGQKQGPRAGHQGSGPGMLGRSAAAALCSARCQHLEPRNAYRWETLWCGGFIALQRVPGRCAYILWTFKHTETCVNASLV